MNTKWFAFAFILFCSVLSTSQASDRVVTIGVAHFPPYSFAEEGNIAGVEVEIIRESLSAMGYWPEFVGFPYGRLPIAFTNKQVDASVTVHQGPIDS